MQIMEGDVIRTIRDNEHLAHLHTGGVPERHELDSTQEFNRAAIYTPIVEMMVGPLSRVLITTSIAIGASVVLTLPVAAQVTTGTVEGTVTDEQGGVIPGATLVLVSEARGTKSAPAVTSATGDFVIPISTAGSGMAPRSRSTTR